MSSWQKLRIGSWCISTKYGTARVQRYAIDVGMFTWRWTVTPKGQARPIAKGHQPKQFAAMEDAEAALKQMSSEAIAAKAAPARKE